MVEALKRKIFYPRTVYLINLVYTYIYSCTNAAYYGCKREGTTSHPLNPVRSARIRTMDSFHFKYGKVEVSAKMPAGDWLWPAIWFMPKDNVYGTWPSSGEIDLVESRGNRDYVQKSVNIGTEQISSTLHYGPYAKLNAYETTHFNRNSVPGNGWGNDIHRYQMEWTPGNCFPFLFSLHF